MIIEPMDSERMLHCTLITPRAGVNEYYFDFSLESAYEELGLGYLASSLSAANYDVEVLDGPAMGLNINAILERLRLTHPRIVGLTLINQTLAEGEFIARQVKAERPNTHVVVGGHLPTNAPLDVLNGCEAFDTVVLGYGEETLVEICDCIFAGRSVADVCGVVHRENGRIVRNIPRPLPSILDSVPFPDRTALRYKISHGHLPLARMITSRGCPYRCSYCTTPAFLDAHCPSEGQRWFPRSPQNVVTEVEELVQNLGVKVIVFCDDEFVAKVRGGNRRAIEIARAIQERGLPVRFWAMFRVDDFCADDDRLVAELKQAGLWGVFLGVEAGADSQLKVYGKGVSVAQNRQALDLFKRHNVLVEIGSMTFYPEVTFDELLSTGHFLAQVGEASLFRYFTSRLAIYPGERRLIDRLADRDLLLPTFSYRNEYGYRFANPSITELVEALLPVTQSFESLDLTVWNARRVIQILGDMINTSLSESAHTDLENVRAELLQVDADIGKANHRLFSECVRAAAEGKKKKDIDVILRRYTELIDQRINNLLLPLRRLQSLKKWWMELPHGDFLERLYHIDLWEKLCLTSRNAQ